MELPNKLATMFAKAAAESRADRTGGFLEIFERPPAYTPAELIKMVFDRTTELTPNERELIRHQAKIFGGWDHGLLAEIAAGAVMESLTLRSIFANFLHATYHRDSDMANQIESLTNWAGVSERLSQINSELADLFKNELRAHVQSAKARGKKAANARHGAQGGSRSKQQGMRDAWATGKYTSRDRCAEEECGALGMSFSAARKALRNTPDPA